MPLSCAEKADPLTRFKAKSKQVLHTARLVRAVRLKHLFRELRCNLTPISNDVLVGEFVIAFVAGAYEMFPVAFRSVIQNFEVWISHEGHLSPQGHQLPFFFAVDDTT